MPLQSVLTLNTKAYNPRGKTGDISQWALVGDSTFGGATSLVQTSVRGPSKEGVYRVRGVLRVPKAATADSPCACTGQELGYGDADIQIRVPTSFTAAERLDFYERLKSLVGSAAFKAAVSDLEPSW